MASALPQRQAVTLRFIFSGAVNLFITPECIHDLHLIIYTKEWCTMKDHLIDLAIQIFSVFIAALLSYLVAPKKGKKKNKKRKKR